MMKKKKDPVKKYKNRIAVKSQLGFILLLVVFAAAASFIGYREFTDALIEDYAEGGYLIASAAAKDIDKDALDEWLESGGEGSAYRHTLNRLDRMCNAADVMFIYVIRPDFWDYGRVTYIFSTVNHDSEYTPYEVGFVKDTTNQEYRRKYQALWEGRSSREMLVLNSGKYAASTHHITVMIPLKNSEGRVRALLCVQRQMDKLGSVRRGYVRKVLLLTVILILLVILGQGAYQNRTLLQPLRKITRESSRFAEENVLSGKKLSDEIRNTDEIGLLAASIDQMEERIVTYVDDLTKITAERERANTELSLAARIQKAMLPDRFPAFPDRTEFDIRAGMDPAREVGGDFFDFFLVDDDHLYLAIADVSGKGVPAALFMMSSMIILANYARQGKTPAQILQETNNTICAGNTAEMFVTVWIGILEISTGKLTAANAGHEYPAVQNADGEFELLRDRHGLVIGGMEDMRYTDYEVMLRPGQKLFVYTDGVPEAMDSENRLFGTERILSALNAQKTAAPEQILKNVRAAVDDFVKDAEQFDDLTMLCLEYRAPVNC